MALFGMCTHHPTTAAKLVHADTKADVLFKRVFCNYLLLVGTAVGHGLLRTLLLSFLPYSLSYRL